MSNLDWDWLRSECDKWLGDKCNDVKATENLIALKDKAETKGFTRIQVSKVIHKLRKIKDEISRDKQHTKPVPEPEPPAEEKVQEVPELQGTESEISRRVEFGDAGTGGRPKRKSSMSIIDMAESNNADS